MDSLIKFILPSVSNYNIVNLPNIYNFLYMTFNKLDERAKKEYFQQMKLTLGLEFTKDFQAYLFRKVPSQELFAYFD